MTVKSQWQAWAKRNHVSNARRFRLYRRLRVSPRARREYLHFD
jgi:hypothetical protein